MSSTRVFTSKSGALMASLILAPPGQTMEQMEQIEIQAQQREQQQQQANEHHQQQLQMLISLPATPASNASGTQENSRASSTLTSPTASTTKQQQQQQQSFFGGGVATTNDESAAVNNMRLDIIHAAIVPDEDKWTDRHIIRHLYPYELPPTPKTNPVVITPPQQATPEMHTHSLNLPLSTRVRHLITPSRKKQITEDVNALNAPFTKLFQLPSYTMQSLTPMQMLQMNRLSPQVSARRMAGSDATSIPASPQQTTQSLSTSSSSLRVDVTRERAMSISLLPPTPQNAQPAIPPIVLLHPNTEMKDNSSNVPSIESHQLSSSGTLLPSVTVRDAKIISKIVDPWFLTKTAKKLNNVTHAVENFIEEGKHAVHEPVPVNPAAAALSSTAFALTRLHTLASHVHQRKLTQDEIVEKQRSLDQRKEFAHKKYMDLVCKHVRVRMIQEGKFVAAGAGQTNNETLIKRAQQQQEESARGRREREVRAKFGELPPVQERNIYKEVMGYSRPTSASMQQEHQFASGLMSPSVLLSPTSSFTQSSHTFGFTSPSSSSSTIPPDPSSVFISDSLSYYYNPSYTPSLTSSGIEYSLDSRGPSDTWQELLEDEEIQLYQKVMWCVQIRELVKIELRKLLELILEMTEIAYDVEVIHKANESSGGTSMPTSAAATIKPSTSNSSSSSTSSSTFSYIYFIKSGEISLKLNRDIIDEMEWNIKEGKVSGLGSQQQQTDGDQGGSATAASASPNHLLPSPSHASASSSPADSLIEIATLGQLNMCGEDIFLSPTSQRRYTLISLTPVWLYRVRASSLLACFTPSEQRSFLQNISHTQHVRERHALVKCRTRLVHHAAPTRFRHFVDENLMQPLHQRDNVRNGKKVNAVAVHQTKEKKQDEKRSSIKAEQSVEEESVRPFDTRQVHGLRTLKEHRASMRKKDQHQQQHQQATIMKPSQSTHSLPTHIVQNPALLSMSVPKQVECEEKQQIDSIHPPQPLVLQHSASLNSLPPVAHVTAAAASSRSLHPSSSSNSSRPGHLSRKQSIQLALSAEQPFQGVDLDFSVNSIFEKSLIRSKSISSLPHFKTHSRVPSNTPLW